MKYELTKENFLEIINSEFVPPLGGFTFDLGDIEVTVKKPYSKDENGYEKGNSIYIENDDEITVFIKYADTFYIKYRENEDDEFAALETDGPKKVRKFAEKTWYKIVDFFDELKTLEISDSINFEEVSDILNSDFVPKNGYPWIFELDDSTVTIVIEAVEAVEEPDAEIQNGYIHINNNEGLEIYIRVAKPEAEQVVNFSYREKVDDEFTVLNNDSPKKIIYFLNNIWQKIVDHNESRMEYVFEFEKFIAQFGDVKVPDSLKAFYQFEKLIGHQNFTECFYLNTFDKSGLKTWSKDKDFLSGILEFATANGSGSFYCFWKISDDLNECPVVVFGDEGGFHVVAENILGLMQLLTYDTEIMVDFDYVSFYKDEDEYEESAYHPEYVEWLKKNFNLYPITTEEEVDALVAKAQEKYEEKFLAWMGQYFKDE